MANQYDRGYPWLSGHNFLFKDILGHDPESAWKFCESLEKKWKEEYSKDSELLEGMNKFAKAQRTRLIWVSGSEKFGKSRNASQDIQTFLTQTYDSCLSNSKSSPPFLSNSTQGDGNEHSDSENDRTKRKQLIQHIEALVFLFSSIDEKVPLSTDLIKETHKILMRGLYSSSDEKMITAGEYRSCSKYDGSMHSYPEFKYIPETMLRIVQSYHLKSQERHNPFELAAWLLYELLTIHPFEDGNGRVSRLCWAYSLIRDGLPFPAIPIPGIRSVYKKYIWCIKRDRQRISSSPSFHPHKCITSFTLISATKTWESFLQYVKTEIPNKYGGICEWLHASGNTLAVKLAEDCS